MNHRQGCRCSLEKLSAIEGQESNSNHLHREGITSNLVALLKCFCSEITWFLVSQVELPAHGATDLGRNEQGLWLLQMWKKHRNV